jgi:undecaprenyl-diphosphatase
MTTAYGAHKLTQNPQNYDLTAVATIAGFSFLAAWGCIHWFMKYIQKIDFIWFMHYRIVLAVLILISLL